MRGQCSRSVAGSSIAAVVIALFIFMGINREKEQRRTQEDIHDAAPPKPAQQPRTRGAKRGGQLSEDNEPCAVGIATDERLRRLRRYGPVRQTGDDSIRETVWERSLCVAPNNARI